VSGKVPFASTVYFAQSDITNLLQNGLLHIYSTNHTPADADVLATYTAIEANGGAGWATPLTVNDWTAAALDAGNVARSQAGVYTFLFSGVGGPITIYGIFLTDPGTTKLYYAEKFITGGIVLTLLNDPVSYQPRWGDVTRF
jgi:hypothetical protein